MLAVTTQAAGIETWDSHGTRMLCLTLLRRRLLWVLAVDSANTSNEPQQETFCGSTHRLAHDDFVVLCSKTEKLSTVNAVFVRPGKNGSARAGRIILRVGSFDSDVFTVALAHMVSDSKLTPVLPQLWQNPVLADAAVLV